MSSFHTLRNKQDTPGIFRVVNKAEINAIVFIQSLAVIMTTRPKPTIDTKNGRQ